MRALNAHGWIDFRMRAMLMSFTSYHLWLPWRSTGEPLARLFTGYEPGIHWSQMQMQSASAGIDLPRIDNPIKQGQDFDTDGSFIRRWVSELEVAPATLVALTRSDSVRRCSSQVGALTQRFAGALVAIAAITICK